MDALSTPPIPEPVRVAARMQERCYALAWRG
jgi:hypothetical protein